MKKKELYFFQVANIERHETKRNQKVNKMTVTTDLSKFGNREIKMASELLMAYIENNRTEYLYDGVKIAFNQNSGYVFLTDEDYNVAMVEDGELVDYFSTPYDGHEGTKLELMTDYYDDMCEEDREYMDNL